MRFQTIKSRAMLPALILALLPALLPAWFPVTATAEPTITLEEEQLARIFTSIIAKESIWPVSDLEISGFSAFPAQVTIPAGIIDYRLESPAAGNHLGRQSLDVMLLVNGQEEQKVRMNANLLRLGDVVLTKRRINRGEVVSPEDLIVQRREVTTLGNFISDPGLAVGMRARTTLQAGGVIYQNLLEKPPLVARGDRVRIVAGNRRLQISAPGEARELGARDEFIRVRNLMSRKEIVARVVDASTVEVDM